MNNISLDVMQPCIKQNMFQPILIRLISCTWVTRGWHTVGLSNQICLQLGRSPDYAKQTSSVNSLDHKLAGTPRSSFFSQAIWLLINQLLILSAHTHTCIHIHRYTCTHTNHTWFKCRKWLIRSPSDPSASRNPSLRTKSSISSSFHFCSTTSPAEGTPVSPPTSERLVSGRYLSWMVGETPVGVEPKTNW